MSRYILAVDQSTSLTKAMLFDEKLQLMARTNAEHRQIYPRPGWVEHDPMEIYENLVRAAAEVVKASGIDPEDVACLSLSNQRETTLIWDEETGLPVYNAIVWQCCRAEEIVREAPIAAMKRAVAEKTGLTLSPYFSAAKASWIVRNAPTENKRLMFGTVDSWLIWKLTGIHATDYSNASRTQLFNLRSLEWDRELIDLFGLSEVAFPEVLPADAVFGYTDVGGVFGRPIPLAGVMGDSHGALFGQQCWEKGMGKCTFGTGSSVMMNIGDKPVFSSQGIATSIAWGLGDRVEYVLEGNINCTGDTVRWLVEMGILPDSKSSEIYAQKVPSNEGVYLVPAFTGLGAPHYVSDARALLCGLSRNSNRNHVVRAALEAIAYQIKDIVDPMVAAAGMPFEELRVDGGPTNNRFLMQFVADMLGLRVVCSQVEELSALGAACAGGLAVSIFENQAQIAGLRRAGSTYVRTMAEHDVRTFYDGWKKSLDRVK